MDEILAYWLVPAEPFRSAFAREISRLAAEPEAPEFTPHVTIYAGPLKSRDVPEAIISAAAGDFPQIALQPGRVGHSERYTKTLFLEFADSDELSSLSNRLRELSAPRADYELKPHLSLAYQLLPEERRAALARSIELPREPVRFDEIHAVICPSPTESSEDVRGWRVVHRRRLPAR